ncbi:hypothetical protein GGF31_001867 [Allomyces arbusculus]|nr:hypothetical protein GGF31_001867 [Allomyces arbusculus]
MPPHAVPPSDADTGNVADRSPPMHPNAGPGPYDPYDYARDRDHAHRDRDRAHRDRPFAHSHAHAPQLPSNTTPAPANAASPYAGPRYYADDTARVPAANARAAPPPRPDWRTDPRAGPPPYWAAPDPYYYRGQPHASYPYPPPPPPPHAYAHHARGPYPPPPHPGYPPHPAHAPRYDHAPGGDRRASPAAERGPDVDVNRQRDAGNGNRDVAAASLPMTLPVGTAAPTPASPPRARPDAPPSYAHRPPPPHAHAGYYPPPPPPEHDPHATAYAYGPGYGGHHPSPYGYPPQYPPYGHYPPHPHAHMGPPPHAYAPPPPPPTAAGPLPHPRPQAAAAGAGMDVDGDRPPAGPSPTAVPIKREVVSTPPMPAAARTPPTRSVAGPAPAPPAPVPAPVPIPTPAADGVDADARDDEDLGSDGDKPKRQYYIFNKLTYELMVASLVAGPRGARWGTARPEASPPLDAIRAALHAAVRRPPTTPGAPASMRVFTMEEALRYAAATSTPPHELAGISRKKWGRLKASLHLVPGRDLYRCLAWAGGDLMVAPREDWHDIIRDAHLTRDPDRGHVEHRSLKQTFLAVKARFQTRRSRGGINYDECELYCQSCVCYGALDRAVMEARVHEDPAQPVGTVAGETVVA